jgi:hypothetical protein
VKTLEELTSRLEVVNDRLAKKPTDALRAEQNDLMVEIQRQTQEHRNKFDADWRHAHSHLTTHEQIELGKTLPKSPNPGTVDGGVS